MGRKIMNRHLKIAMLDFNWNIIAVLSYLVTITQLHDHHLGPRSKSEPESEQSDSAGWFRTN